MKYRMVSIIAAVWVVLLATPFSVSAIEEYLNDTADSSLLVEVTIPGVTDQQPTFWGTVKQYLGIRNIAKTKPAIGTQFTVNSSAYASSPYQTDSTPCITAAGTRVRPGVVASNFLPLGTILDINGEEYIVEDRMNARYAGYFLDLWFPSTSSALEFGRKKLVITIKDYGSPGDPIREEKLADNEPEKTVEVENPSVWSRITLTFSNVKGFLGAKVNPNVNRFDIDCSVEGAGE